MYGDDAHPFGTTFCQFEISEFVIFLLGFLELSFKTCLEGRNHFFFLLQRKHLSELLI